MSSANHSNATFPFHLHPKAISIAVGIAYASAAMPHRFVAPPYKRVRAGTTLPALRRIPPTNSLHRAVINAADTPARSRAKPAFIDPLAARRIFVSRFNRPFSQHRRRLLQGGVALTATATLGACGGTGDSAGVAGAASRLAAQSAAPSLPAPSASGIDHVVLVVMENRSFDHYLGWVPGANGRPAGLQFNDAFGQT
jgi:hypothetical protein